MTGKICSLRYQTGDDSSSSIGVVKRADENWIVLDGLQFRRNNIVAQANGSRSSEAVYSRLNRQYWIATRLVIEANFDFGATIR
jgi:hypothetical protein